MTLFRRFSWFLFLFGEIGLVSEAYAQSSFWVFKGKVVEYNQSPVEFANVYVNNTSVGTATNATGNFTLQVPKSIQKIELVISSIGYNSVKKNLSPKDVSKELVFFLETNNLLKEVKVTAKHDREWRKKWRIFKNGLLGESIFNDDCEILNPDDIKLSYDEHRKVVATSNKPIYIRNDGLGYKIMFQMSKFVSDGDETFYSGDKFFEKLTPKDEKQAKRWARHQQRDYKDSFRNFLVALSQNKVDENKYAIFKMATVKKMYTGRTTVASELADSSLIACRASQICTFDSLTNQYYLHSEQPLLIFLTNRFSPIPVFVDYPYKYSQIELPHLYLEFAANGWITKPNGVILRDLWGHEGFSNLLPDDFISNGEIPDNDDDLPLADNEQLDSLQNKHKASVEFWAIKGKVLTVNNKSIVAANVFINNTSIVTKTDSTGSFLLSVPKMLPEAELVVASEGFNLFKRKVSPEKIAHALADDSLQLLTFHLNYTKDSVKVAEQEATWQKNSTIFNRTLLGESPFMKDCEIVNPTVVSFSETNKKLAAKANTPLIIQNNGLGLKITYYLNQLAYDEDAKYVTGEQFFEQLTPADQKQEQTWRKNRSKAYRISLRYFLESLSQNKLKENGFEAFKMVKIDDEYNGTATMKSHLADSSMYACNAAKICTFVQETNRYYLHSEYPLLVFLTKLFEPAPIFSDYQFKFAQLVLPKGYIEFTKNGLITNANQLSVRDFWRKQGISVSLPDNFLNDFNYMEELETSDVKGLTNNNIIKGMQFSKKGLNVEEDKTSMVPLDYTIKISENDRNATIFDLLRRIPGLKVTFHPESGDYSIMFLGNRVGPALLLDGFLIDDTEMVTITLNSLNVREIDKVGAVKFASSAMFGSRGGGGTIVITTKK